ncbi:MAG: VWA domain-containing protein, partial [Thermoanaerobaculia bacterium]|nr:VWA domain-containing protein [Thermoanaerobaculia bacterium]
LVLKLEDRHGAAFHRREHQLQVPQSEELFVPAASRESETSRLFAEATAAVARGETSIRIVPPRTLLQRGMVRFDTLAVGDDIERVAFLLDERRLLTKNRPPYNVEIDLGEFPQPHSLRVEALDASGEVVAEDEIQLNAAGARFAVKLLEPRSGQSYGSSLLARARIDVPSERSVERVELYLNERLVATLYQPPWAQPMALPPAGELTYVRAVAYLANGDSAEDLVFIEAPDQLEAIDIQVVELYTTVLDRFGRPVPGLERDDFEVFEDKVKQEIVRFEPVADQPIRLGILFDNSASMGPVLDHARIAALRLFQDAITPRDQAAVVTFNRIPKLAVPLTNDLRRLGGGLAGLSAEGETALYDSIMFGLYYFASVKGQRALVLLSDGRDEVSRFGYQETLDYSRRAGVTLYAISLARNEPGGQARLERLAEETGGRFFQLDDLAQLSEVYSLIEQELRSQYLLTYQSSNSSGGEDFRVIRVELGQKDLEPRTLSGYYP